MRFRTGYVLFFGLLGVAFLAMGLLYWSSQGGETSIPGLYASLIALGVFFAISAIYAVWSIINFARLTYRRFTRSHLYQPIQGTVSRMWEKRLSFPYWLFLENPQVIVAKYSFGGKALTTYLMTMNSNIIEQAAEEETVDLRVDPDYHHDVMFEAKWAKKHSASDEG